MTARGGRCARASRGRRPAFAGVYAAGGFGAASRQWHEYARRHVLPAADELRPVLYNSWEGTWFDVNEANQRELAAVAAELGVELFVMDDGWFGRRLSDNAGLGDWWPNPDRFPGGLAPLIAEVHRLGMRFGLWVEPEMVNPDSDLYRAHPDWVLHMPHRDRTELRNQLVLNFARADVARWAYGWLDRLLADHEIDFLKWDMNRAFTEAGWPGSDDPHRLFWGHTEAVYDILDRLRAAHPRRADRDLLQRRRPRRPRHPAPHRPGVDLGQHRPGRPDRHPARLRAGLPGGDHGRLGQREPEPAQRAAYAAAVPVPRGDGRRAGHQRQPAAAGRPRSARRRPTLVSAYKRIRPVVQRGRLFRLTPAATDRLTAVQYVLGDESVVLAWRALHRFGHPDPPLRLAGLDAAARYREQETGREYDGAVLSHHGLVPDLPRGDHASTVIHLRRC